MGNRLDVESITSELGVSGGFIIRNHEGLETEISIEATDSLRGIAQKINESSEESGVTATIIDNRLILQDGKTGDRGIELADPDGQTSVIEDLGLGIDAELRQGTQARSP